MEEILLVCLAGVGPTTPIPSAKDPHANIDPDLSRTEAWSCSLRLAVNPFPAFIVT